MMTDEAVVTMRLKAPRQIDFDNGDRKWPDGLYLEYYNDSAQVISTFRSNFAEYIAEESIYKGEGDVVVRNVQNGDELNTEELFWDPSEEIFYTEKFVTIVSEGEVHTGSGLEANQDFTSYTILNPKGTLTIEE
jgi:LPS export ABC transporter protein LptC